MKHRPTQYLTEKEVEDVLRQPDKTTFSGLRDWCLLRLLLTTGIRRSEIVKLKRGSLRRSGNSLWLEVWGKADEPRMVPIKDPDLIEYLLRYFKKVGTDENPEAPMFYTLSQRGGRTIQAIGPETIRRVVEKYSRLAKIQKRITPHSLRHSLITNLLNKGVPLHHVRDLVGHKNLQTTSGYAHSKEEDLEKAIEKLGY